MIRGEDKEPPRSPLLTWDEEQTAKEAAADDETTPLCSPEAVSRLKQKKVRFSHQPDNPAAQQPHAATARCQPSRSS
jgi:hypothetical protein